MSTSSPAGNAPPRSDAKIPDIATVPGSPRAEVGEGIIWCDRTRHLWWVDIGRSLLHRSDPRTGTHEEWSMPGKIGCLALTDGREVVVALTEGLFAFDPRSGRLTLLSRLPGEPLGNRPNDGAVSRAGRFYVGTVPIGDRSVPGGHLYICDGVGAVRILSGLHVANGLAFSPDDRTAYLSDSWPDIRTVWAFDHDPDSGALSRRRVFFDSRVTAGRPDGACVDADGCYWMAGVGGAELLRLTPRGKIDLRIDLPVARPSKPCFGGPELKTLFVSSIGGDAADAGPDGHVLCIDVPYQGLPEPRLPLSLHRSPAGTG